jgi:hypothetical protein
MRASTRLGPCIYTHTRTHAHVNTHAEKHVILFGFPQQQWIRERASVLQYTNIACLLVHVEHLKTEIHKCHISWRDSVNAQLVRCWASNQMVGKKEKVCQRSTGPGCVLQMNFANSQEIVAVVSDVAQWCVRLPLMVFVNRRQNGNCLTFQG